MSVGRRGLKIAFVFVLVTVFQLQHRDMRYDRSQSSSLADLSRQFSLQFPSVAADTPNDPVDLAKALYYYVAGPPSSGYPGGFVGPEEGLFGILDEILGDPQMQNQFFDLNVTSCNTIPTEGVMSVPKHAQGNLKFNFSPGSRRNPRHFGTRPRGRLQKRLDVDRNGTPIMSMELSCDNGDGIVSGYIFVEGERNIEVYYQFESLGNRRQVDVYMDFPKAQGNTSDEKFVLRFESIDGEDYQIWTVRTTKNSDDNDGSADSDSVGVAIRGNRKTSRAQVSVVKDTSGNPDDVTEVTAGTQYCVNTETGVSTTDCDPIQKPEEGVKGDTFTIGETDALPVETIDYLRSDSFFHEFESTLTGAVTRHTLTVTNVGIDTIAEITPRTMDLPFSYVGGVYPGSSGTCGASLARGASCSLEIQFSPTATGSFTGQVAIDYSYLEIGKTLWVDILGTTTDGVPTGILASFPTPNLRFLPRAIGSVGKKFVTVTNTGKGNVNGLGASVLVAPFGFVGGAYPGTAGTCTTTLASESSCRIEIAFAPTEASESNSPLSLTYSDGQAEKSLNLTLQGQGTSPSQLAISETDPYVYGTTAVGASAEHLFTVTNSGDSAAFELSGPAIIGPFGFKGGAYPGVGGTCGSSLPGGSSCSVAVLFAPIASGTFMSSLVIDYSDGSTGQIVSRTLQGSANGAALLAFSEVGAHDFGSALIGSVPSHLFMVTNNGDTNATAISEVGLATPFHFLGGSYPGTGGTCGATLTPLETCQLNVEFQPINSGPANGSLQLVYNNGISSQSTSLSLLGSGATEAQLTISEAPSYDFGSVPAGSGQTHRFTITNGGGWTATALVPEGPDVPFGFQGGAYPGAGGTCTASLAANANCDIVLALAPTSAGVVNGSMTLEYNGGLNAATVTLDVSGTGTVVASLSLSEVDPFSFGVVPVGGAVSQVFAITNSGGAAATAMTEIGLAAPFSFSGGGYPGTGGTCGSTLGAGSSCNISVVASPVITGLQSDAIQVSYSDGVSNQIAIRNIQVTGSSPALLVLSGSDPFSFGDLALGATASHVFTLTNSGGVSGLSVSETTLAAPYSFSGGAYPGAQGTCSSVLASGASCTLEVTLSPVVAGIQSGNLTASYNDGVTTRTVSRALTANGTALAALPISDGPSQQATRPVSGRGL